MSGNDDLFLQWRNFHSKLSSALCSLLQREILVDITLACEGQTLKAHQAVLSACSPYFEKIFSENSTPHPIVILKDIKYEEMTALLHFMYYGETRVAQSQLPGFLRAAETLHISGLSGDGGDEVDQTIPESEDEEDDMEMEANPTQPDNNSYVCGSEHGEPTASDGNQDRVETITIKEDPDQSSENTEEWRDNASANPMAETEGMLEGRNVPSNQCRLSSVNHSNRQRVMWSPAQVRQLEEWYRLNRYPCGAETKEYARSLKTPNGRQPTRQNVDYWFQNRRRKDNHPEVLQQREKRKQARLVWMQMRQEMRQAVKPSTMPHR